MNRWGETRDKVALRALTALLANPGVCTDGADLKLLPQLAYRLADIMLATRHKAQEGSDE